VSTQPPVEYELGLFSRVKWPGVGVDHLTLSEAEVKNVWRYLLPLYAFRA
jgi:hypothetical protein